MCWFQAVFADGQAELIIELFARGEARDDSAARGDTKDGTPTPPGTGGADSKRKESKDKEGSSKKLSGSKSSVATRSGAPLPHEVFTPGTVRAWSQWHLAGHVHIPLSV